MRADFFDTRNSAPDDVNEAERLRCAKLLNPLRAQKDAVSLKQAVEYLDHADFEVRSLALEIVSYRYMGDPRPGLEETIKIIQNMYEKLISSYDAGGVSDEEVKEVGESCLLALFRIGGWNPSLLLKKQHIEPLKDYMAEYMPKEDPYEGYETMKDPEAAQATRPPVDWLQKRDFQQIKFNNIEQSGIKYEVAMLINRKRLVLAVTINDQLCNITTRLAHTNSYNSGNRRYTCVRPESLVVLPGRMLQLSDAQILSKKLEYNEYRQTWGTDWSQMESGEVYNTVVYDHYSCYLSLKPAELKGEFTIFTSTDTTT